MISYCPQNVIETLFMVGNNSERTILLTLLTKVIPIPKLQCMNGQIVLAYDFLFCGKTGTNIIGHFLHFICG